MEPMKPMEPLTSMQGEALWPRELGQASASGGQNGLRYAVFAGQRRLVVERDGRRATYDTGDRRIDGVQQGSDGPVFTGPDGEVQLDTLRVID